MGGAVKSISNVVSSVVDFVVKTVEKVVDFAVNVVTGVLKNVVGAITGAINGDWTKFRDSLLGVVSTAIYGVAAVVGFVTGQYYIAAAALVALDGQYNEGQLTSHIVTTVGKFEREIFGSKNILDNVDIITSGIVIIGSLYAGAKGIGLLGDITGLNSYLSQYSNYVNYFKVATGAYSVYDAYTQWQHAIDLYDQLVRL
jgi:phage-related protein